MQGMVSADEISIGPFSDLCDMETIEQIASLYRKGFRGDPWHDAYQCTVCLQRRGVSYNGKECPLCGGALIERWTIPETTEEFLRSMRQPGAHCLLARCGKLVIGVVVGFEAEPNASLSDYMETPGFHEQLHAIGGRAFYYYLDEVIISEGYRRHNIGCRLVKALIAGKDQGSVLLYTVQSSPMYRLANKLGGKAIFQAKETGRIVMVI